MELLFVVAPPVPPDEELVVEAAVVAIVEDADRGREGRNKWLGVDRLHRFSAFAKIDRWNKVPKMADFSGNGRQ